MINMWNESMLYQLLLVSVVCVLIGACSTPSSEGISKIPSPESSSSSSSQSANESEAPDQYMHASEKGGALEQQSKDSAQASVQTNEEAVAVLDKQLEEELQNYDKRLHEELEKAEEEKQVHTAQREVMGRNTEFDTEEDIGDSDIGESQESGEQVVKVEPQQPQSNSGQEASNENTSRGGRQAQNVRNDTPNIVPSGSDDDVVARQLREAAEKEEDSVLREKLWEEYRKYKKQQVSVSTPSSNVKK